MTARQLMTHLSRIVGNTIGNPAVWPEGHLTREQLHQIRYAVTELTWNEVFAIIEAQDRQASVRLFW